MPQEQRLVTSTRSDGAGSACRPVSDREGMRPGRGSPATPTGRLALPRDEMLQSLVSSDEPPLSRRSFLRAAGVAAGGVVPRVVRPGPGVVGPLARPVCRSTPATRRSMPTSPSSVAPRSGSTSGATTSPTTCSTRSPGATRARTSMSGSRASPRWPRRSRDCVVPDADFDVFFPTIGSLSAARGRGPAAPVDARAAAEPLEPLAVLLGGRGPVLRRRPALQRAVHGLLDRDRLAAGSRPRAETRPGSWPIPTTRTGTSGTAGRSGSTTTTGRRSRWPCSAAARTRTPATRPRWAGPSTIWSRSPRASTSRSRARARTRSSRRASTRSSSRGPATCCPRSGSGRPQPTMPVRSRSRGRAAASSAATSRRSARAAATPSWPTPSSITSSTWAWRSGTSDGTAISRRSVRNSPRSPRTSATRSSTPTTSPRAGSSGRSGRRPTPRGRWDGSGSSPSLAR